MVKALQVASKVRLKGGRRCQKDSGDGRAMTMWTQAVLNWTGAKEASSVATGVKRPPKDAIKMAMRADFMSDWARAQARPRKLAMTPPLATRRRLMAQRDEVEARGPASASLAPGRTVSSSRASRRERGC